MNNLKTALLKELDDTRSALWQALESVQPETGQRVRDIYAHIAGWESLVFEAIRAYLYDIPATAYPYSGVDAANHDFVTKRQGMTVIEAKRECEINRFAIRTMLAGIPAENFDDMFHFPWGSESVTTFIKGAISHEREHLDEIAKATHSE